MSGADAKPRMAVAWYPVLRAYADVPRLTPEEMEPVAVGAETDPEFDRVEPVAAVPEAVPNEEFGEWEPVPVPPDYVWDPGEAEAAAPGIEDPDIPPEAQDAGTEGLAPEPIGGEALEEDWVLLLREGVDVEAGWELDEPRDVGADMGDFELEYVRGPEPEPAGVDPVVQEPDGMDDEPIGAGEAWADVEETAVVGWDAADPPPVPWDVEEHEVVDDAIEVAAIPPDADDRTDLRFQLFIVDSGSASGRPVTGVTDGGFVLAGGLPRQLTVSAVVYDDMTGLSDCPAIEDLAHDRNLVWECSAGRFMDGDNLGTVVTWEPPAEPVQDLTIRVTAGGGRYSLPCGPELACNPRLAESVRVTAIRARLDKEMSPKFVNWDGDPAGEFVYRLEPAGVRGKACIRLVGIGDDPVLSLSDIPSVGSDKPYLVEWSPQGERGAIPPGTYSVELLWRAESEAGHCTAIDTSGEVVIIRLRLTQVDSNAPFDPPNRMCSNAAEPDLRDVVYRVDLEGSRDLTAAVELSKASAVGPMVARRADGESSGFGVDFSGLRKGSTVTIEALHGEWGEWELVATCEQLVQCRDRADSTVFRMTIETLTNHPPMHTFGGLKNGWGYLTDGNPVTAGISTNHGVPFTSGGTYTPGTQVQADLGWGPGRGSRACYRLVTEPEGMYHGEVTCPVVLSQSTHYIVVASRGITGSVGLSAGVGIAGVSVSLPSVEHSAAAYAWGMAAPDCSMETGGQVHAKGNTFVPSPTVLKNVLADTVTTALSLPRTRMEVGKWYDLTIKHTLLASKGVPRPLSEASVAVWITNLQGKLGSSLGGSAGVLFAGAGEP